ncbi:TIGR01244 family sulfur transferase [Rhodovulum sp. MB263]|uniref:TIGR01244 family sulfur transferase n=1 Tax=Rhodovulum sp. (strain MB263) TaxID=308754 RepID=UPI001E43369A|nr:TIGR01244 family sulfur transferase [Rhodovulum sp. MB263]
MAEDMNRNAEGQDLPPMTWLDKDFAAAPQPGIEYLEALAQAGFRSVICNRPDEEVAADEGAAAMEAAARAAGLGFAAIPVHHAPITPAMIEAQARAMATLPGPVFAYCRAGFRSSVIWALAQAGRQPTEDIMAALDRAGFAMPGLREQIEELARGR